MSKMKFHQICSLLIISAVVVSCFDSNITPTFYQLVKIGDTLMNKTLFDIKAISYKVAMAGAIENYSKWKLTLKTCEVVRGYMNVNPPNVISAGHREGFATHKAGHVATGVFVRCTYNIGGGYVFHFMYSVPYSFDLHSNWLALATCHESDQECKSLTARKMYYMNSPLVARKRYYQVIDDVVQCGGGVCVVGNMGTSHQPNVQLRLYPSYYNDLDVQMKTKSGITEDQYKKLIAKYYKKASS